MTGCSATGPTASLTLGEVIRQTLPDFSRTHRLSRHHWKVLRASPPVTPRRWAAISIGVPTVGESTSPRTPAATGTVRAAKG